MLDAIGDGKLIPAQAKDERVFGPFSRRSAQKPATTLVSRVNPAHDSAIAYNVPIDMRDPDGVNRLLS